LKSIFVGKEILVHFHRLVVQGLRLIDWVLISKNWCWQVGVICETEFGAWGLSFISPLHQ
jgi:hypothetical protein